jgi:hypothetical protein
METNRRKKESPLKTVVETKVKESTWISEEDLERDYKFIDVMFNGHYVLKEELDEVMVGNRKSFSHALSIKRSLENQGVEGEVVRKVYADGTLRTIAREFKKEYEESQREYEESQRENKRKYEESQKEKYSQWFYSSTFSQEHFENTLGMSLANEHSFSRT